MGNRETWNKADYRTANVAPLSSLIEPVFNYIDQIMTSRFPIRMPDGRLVTNKCQIEWFYLKEMTRTSPVHKQFFAFNSYIEHRTIGASAADSLEGKPYGLITYDEGGRSGHLEQEVNGTLLARLFDWGGPLHILSTPDQTSASILYHYKLYQDGLSQINDTYTIEGELKDNIFFPPEQIQKQYELYENNPLRDQVLYGKFVFGGDNVFSFEDIMEAVDNSLNDGVRPLDDHKYVISVDTAIASDEMVYQVLDYTDPDNVYLARQMAAKGNSKSPQLHMNDFLDLFDAYEPTDVIIETWNGESVRFYQDLPDYVRVRTHCYGSWQPEKRSSDNRNQPRSKTATIKKADIILALLKLLTEKKLKIPDDPELKQQLSVYREEDGKLATDRVIALAIGAWFVREGVPKVQEVTFVDW